ncbi:OST-HTH/LOTUS domain-containing protein [Oscillibacter sp.]|uniref:OST-HTH/LOTUS domain-containing protein n=1 Tax=Oscillibacter sp. TaxID=1945593 RepID=UPI0028AC4365|nr:OST-HTH/LOTUS domain-containing protein [Oscillibacter sp.]
MLKYLDTIGINAFRLMPDLQNVCYAIKRKITEERQAKSPLFKRIPIKKADLNEIHVLLKAAFERYKREDGFANIAPVGTYIKKEISNFNPQAYGFSKLSDLIANFPEKYEMMKDDGRGPVPIAVYKCI